MFVCVVLGEDGTIFVDRVIGPFEKKEDAIRAGFAAYTADNEMEPDDAVELSQDEWGRYVNDDGVVAFQVKPILTTPVRPS